MANLSKLRQQTLAAKHLEVQRGKRFDAICATMPPAPEQMVRYWRIKVAIAVSQLGPRQLKHVVWPWQQRPQRTKTPRGRRAAVAVL